MSTGIEKQVSYYCRDGYLHNHTVGFLPPRYAEVSRAANDEGVLVRCEYKPDPARPLSKVCHSFHGGQFDKEMQDYALPYPFTINAIPGYECRAVEFGAVGMAVISWHWTNPFPF